MKFGLLAAVALATLAVAATAQAQDNTSFPPANGGTSVSVPASHYSFSDTGARGVNPKTGIQVANVWGDVTKGAHGAFFRFDPGFVSPLHTHTYDYYAVVIKGDLENYQPGQKPEKLGPGSYWYQRGKQAHTTACVSKEPCEIYIVQQNKFDAQIPPKTE
jgi:quercetin dioxygenase-like cupin family protein